MTRFAARLASIVCTVVLGVAGTAGAARADVPGCYGTSTVVGYVCDPELVVHPPVGVEPWQSPALCGSDLCKQLVVDAFWPSRGEPFQLCVLWTDREGNNRRKCAPLSINPPSGVCPILRGMSGPYGPVVVTEEGDVYVDTVLVWDCETPPDWEPSE